VLGTSVILRHLRGARRLEGDLDLDHLISGLHAAGYLSLRRLFLNLAYRPMPVCPLACLLWRTPNLEESEMSDVQFGELRFQLLKPSPEQAFHVVQAGACLAGFIADPQKHKPSSERDEDTSD
jgi:hypothetical protein